MVLVEVCSNSLRSALAAQEGGAARIELCDNLAEGGTTPSEAQIRIVRQQLSIRMHVIIRPRGGDFLYNKAEYEMMKADTLLCGKLGCDGIVMGDLKPNGTIDTDRSGELTQIAADCGMEVTFHRAFDRCRNLFEGLEDIICKVRCSRILTSGGKDSALLGADTIRQLIQQAEERITIMPGGGITEDNIAELVSRTGLREFHGSFRSPFPSEMQYFNRSLSDWETETAMLFTDAEKVKKAILLANTANSFF